MRVADVDRDDASSRSPATSSALVLRRPRPHRAPGDPSPRRLPGVRAHDPALGLDLDLAFGPSRAASHAAAIRVPLPDSSAVEPSGFQMRDRRSGAVEAGDLEHAVAADPGVDIAEPANALRRELAGVGPLDEEVRVAERVPFLEPHGRRGYTVQTRHESSAISLRAIRSPSRRRGPGSGASTSAGTRRTGACGRRSARRAVRSELGDLREAERLLGRARHRARERRAHLVDDASREHRLGALPDAVLEDGGGDVEADDQRRTAGRAVPEPVAGRPRATSPALRELERTHEPLPVVGMDGLAQPRGRDPRAADARRRGRRRPRARSGRASLRARPAAGRPGRRARPGGTGPFRPTTTAAPRSTTSSSISRGRAPRTRRRSSPRRRSQIATSRVGRVGWFVRIGRPRYTCIASAETTSVPSRSATASATAVLPDAVGPKIADLELRHRTAASWSATCIAGAIRDAGARPRPGQLPRRSAGARDCPFGHVRSAPHRATDLLPTLRA